MVSKQDFNSPADSSIVDEDVLELYENAPCGYLSALPDGNIIKVNATFLQWTGYDKSSLIGKKRFQELLPIAGRIFYDTHFGPLLLMQGTVREIAFQLICPDNSRLPVLLNAVMKRDTNGNPQVIRMTLLDARSRRAYEEELRLAKRKAEEAEKTIRLFASELERRVEERTQERDRIWRISRDILAVVTKDGSILSFNPAFTRILGWEEFDRPGLSLSKLTLPEYLSQLQHVFQTFRDEPLNQPLEIPLYHKHSNHRWISFMIMAEGEIFYLVGRDISEERKQAQALEKAEEALQHAQKMEALGNLTGGIAHDFNNILQVIGGNLELLMLGGQSEMDTQHRLQQAKFAVERGAKIVSQLLSFARRQHLQPSPINLTSVLSEMKDLLCQAVSESVAIEITTDMNLWNTLIDRTQFENAVLNLAVNARHAMKNQGRLRLEATNVVIGEVNKLYPNVPAGEFVLFSIADTGSGIPPEVLEHIFEPFYTTKDVGEGTGLGLSMVYGFVQQSGGYIHVNSQVEHGTTFNIFLPRTKNDGPIQQNPLPSQVEGGIETILIAEDDRAVRETAAAMISGLGYRVLEAADGDGALAVLRSGVEVDLLFTDVMMPGQVLGRELEQHARAISPRIVVLFTSGYEQTALRKDPDFDLDAKLIRKPYERKELARKIRQVLDSRKNKEGTEDIVPSRPSAPKTIASKSSFRILVVEDNIDSLEMVCELLELLGHTSHGTANAEDALLTLKNQPFDVLLTDVSLPGKSGLELAKEAILANASLQVIIASGFSIVEDGSLNYLTLPKPYDLKAIQNVLSLVERNRGSN